MAKSRSLVVVESPTKVKTIQKYLDSGFIVKASMGHIRDLPKSSLGVNEKKGFKPEYKVLPAKKKVLDDLKKAAEKVTSLYIATDPDREGEAIGWHLAQELGIDKKNTHRILFNEITERAVKAAFQNPGKIDKNKVDAQQARRVLDRLVGYKLSPLLWDKIRRGLSAGRVQSVAVRLVTEREREIAAFLPVEYWSLHARLLGKHPPEFTATLREVRGEKASLADEASTTAVVAALEGAQWRVKSVTRGERRRNPAAPFITSTLQQDASRKLHFSAKRTMMLAQQLYEGIELGDEGQVGLITYMRTDAVRVGVEAQAEAREWVTPAAGARVSPRQPAHLQVEEERAGRARGHPPLGGGPGAQGPRRASHARTSSRSTGSSGNASSPARCCRRCTTPWPRTSPRASASSAPRARRSSSPASPRCTWSRARSPSSPRRTSRRR